MKGQNQKSFYEIDTSETSIRVLVFTIAYIAFFLVSDLHILDSIVTRSPMWQESLGDWVFTFVAEFSVFLIIPICYLLATWNVERRLNYCNSLKEAGYIKRLSSQLSFKLGLKNPPKVLFSDSDEPMAFVFGRRKKTAKLVVSKGLTETLNWEELKSVLSHELSHIKNGDVALMTWSTTFLQALKYWSLVLALSFVECLGENFLRGRITYRYISLMLEGLCLAFVIFFLIPMFVITSISRNREYLADARSLTVVEEKSVRSSLKKVYKTIVLKKLKRRLMSSSFCLMNYVPLIEKRSFFRGVFSSHPSLKERLKAIKEKRHFLSPRKISSLDLNVLYGGIMAFALTYSTLFIITIKSLQSFHSLVMFISLFILPVLVIMYVNSHGWLTFFPSNIAGTISGNLSSVSKKEKLSICTNILVKNLLSILIFYLILFCVFYFTGGVFWSMQQFTTMLITTTIIMLIISALLMMF